MSTRLALFACFIYIFFTFLIQMMYLHLDEELQTVLVWYMLDHRQRIQAALLASDGKEWLALLVATNRFQI